MHVLSQFLIHKYFEGSEVEVPVLRLSLIRHPDDVLYQVHFVDLLILLIRAPLANMPRLRSLCLEIVSRSHTIKFRSMLALLGDGDAGSHLSFSLFFTKSKNCLPVVIIIKRFIKFEYKLDKIAVRNVDAST